MSEIGVKLPSGSYSIHIKNETVSETFEKIKSFTDGRNYLAVISEKVFRLYGKSLTFNKNHIFILKDGEKEKNFSNYQKILNKALKLKLTRNSVIIAVGGGVTGDLAGFCASTYMRGIDFVQVPTTLLSCVDSSVGGKTAINTKYGKNLIGTFYQPKVVFINPVFLKTLDERQFKSGLGEVVKYAFIEKSCLCEEDFHLINLLSEKTTEIIARDEKILSKIIEICLKLKVSVVEKDEKESDLRRILNFGHTYGHAVEKITNYKKYTHGEAVIAGMKFAFELAQNKNLIDKNYKFFALDVIKKFGFLQIPNFDIEKINKIMETDKKSNGKNVIFILPTDYSSVDAFDYE